MRKYIGAILSTILATCSLAGAVTHRPKRSTPVVVAKPQAPKVVGAAGLIAVAQRQLDAGNAQSAAEYATSAAAKAPILADYAYWIRAQAEYRLGNYDEVAKSVPHVFDHVPTSPFLGPAAALAAKAELDGQSPAKGLELIKKFRDRIPQPQSDLLLAECLQASGDLPQAAEYFQRVYYNYPTAKEATDAANALVDIKSKLGDAYPPVMPSAMIARAQKLFDAHNPAAAKIELAAAAPQLGGAEADLARVRLGVADYLSGNTEAAFSYLLALKVDSPEADAERLSYIVRCARKADRHADVKTYLTQLEQQHPNSLWRMDTLIHVADQARVDNDAGTYIPLYRACYANFNKDPRSAWCHWQLAFDAYRKDAAEEGDLLRAHIEQYPGSDDVNDALYFLGRLRQRKNDNASARACYDELIALFPNTYYAVAAREQLDKPEMKAATASPEMQQFLKSIPWPARPELPSFTPGETAETRIQRSQLLQMTGLTDMAEAELKFGARNDGEQQNVYAFELAKLAAVRNSLDQAMHYIKAYVPDYLYMPLDEAPAQFWKLAFPIPYRVAIEQHSRQEGLDPFLVAALIRQESEFNAQVISHANAYGLMQLLPTTGRQLARHFGVRRFSATQLLVADRNVQLGTYYFKNMLSSAGGQPEIALAAYNAGPGRANLWRSWGPYREQAEFIESIPFHETRGYVQLVLRNADVYRRLYSGTLPDIPEYHAKPAPVRKSKRAAKHRRRAA